MAREHPVIFNPYPFPQRNPVQGGFDTTRRTERKVQSACSIGSPLSVTEEDSKSEDTIRVSRSIEGKFDISVPECNVGSDLEPRGPTVSRVGPYPAVSSDLEMTEVIDCKLDGGSGETKGVAIGEDVSKQGEDTPAATESLPLQGNKQIKVVQHAVRTHSVRPSDKEFSFVHDQSMDRVSWASDRADEGVVSYFWTLAFCILLKP
ncbi:hypothetical protein U1Q18_009760 [Sarracenia purpurea var. burkii]